MATSFFLSLPSPSISSTDRLFHSSGWCTGRNRPIGRHYFVHAYNKKPSQDLHLDSKLHLMEVQPQEQSDMKINHMPAITNSGEKEVNTLLDSMKWDDKGLAVAIAQNIDTGAILMQGFVNRDALAKTISSRKATFFSRSRSTLWTKGETSMNFINVHQIFIDCDRDSIIYLGKPDGPTCHTGSETCYYTCVFDSSHNLQGKENEPASTTLYLLESTIIRRKEELSEPQNGKPSWTRRLLLDEKLLCSKIREEADELCRTLEENEDRSRTVSEMADVLYHGMVVLGKRGVRAEEVLEVLRLRFTRSGIEEKESRKSKD